MSDALDIITRLASAGAAAPDDDGGEDAAAAGAALLAVELEPLTPADVAAVDAAASATGDTTWFEATDAGVRTEDVGRALRMLMRARPLGGALRAGSVLVGLLQAPGCPILGLFDRLTAAAMFSLVREAGTGGGLAGGRAAPRGRGAAAGADLPLSQANPFSPSPSRGTAGRRRRRPAADIADDVDMEDGGREEEEEEEEEGDATSDDPPAVLAASAAALLTGLAAVLAAFGLADQPDSARAAIEAAADVARSCRAPPAVADAAGAALLALLHARHGPVPAAVVSVVRCLAPGLAGAADGGRPGAAGTGRTPGAVRDGLVRLVKAILAAHPDAAPPAVAAAARYGLLAAPDRADARAGAAAAAASLTPALPWQHAAAVAAFAGRLARSGRIGQRSGAVDLAAALVAEGGPGAFAVPPPLVSSGDQAAVADENAEPGSPTATDGGDGGGAKPPASPVGGEEAEDPLAPPHPPPRPAPREPWGVTALAALLGRTGDKAPTVRAKALGALSGLLTTADEAAARGGCQAASFRDALVAAVARLAAGETTTSLAAARALARARAADDRATVRRAGVVLLDALLGLRVVVAAGGGEAGRGTTTHLPRVVVEPPARADLDALEAAASDAMVTVRRAALAALGRALRAALAAADATEAPAVAAAWARAVLPLARDVEPPVVDAATEEVEALLLGPVLRAAGGDAPAVAAAAAVLAALDAGGAAARVCAGRAAGRLHGLGRLAAPAAATALQALLETGLPASSAALPAPLAAAAARGGWALLAELAAADPAAPDWRFLRRAWDGVHGRAGGGLGGGGGADHLTPSPAAVLRVVSRAAARFPPSDAAALAGELEGALAAFCLDAAAVSAHAAALATLAPVAGGGGGEAATGPVAGWDGRLLAAAEATLGAALAALAPGGVGGAAAARPAAAAACVAGEVALLRGRPLPRRVVALLEALAAPGAAAAAAAEVAAMAVEGEGGGGRAHAEGGAPPPPPPAAAPASSIPAPLRAVAWIALGKACLAHEPTASRLLPLFVAALGGDEAPAVRNNAMVALADMCAAYTALVDAHVLALAAAAGDAHPLVRRQALALLADLLQRDYVRWRGALFLRLLLALADPCPAVAHLAGHLLTDALAAKAPLLAYNHFVEAVYVLNGVPARGGVAGAGGGGQAAALLAGAPGLDALLDGAAGDEGDGDDGGARPPTSAALPASATAATRGPSPAARARRATIYRELLVRMAPEHRFATAARLCGDVLAEALDGAPPPGGAPADPGRPVLALPDEVVRDALRVLGSPEIRVVAPAQRGGGGGGAGVGTAADAEDEADAAAAAVAAEGGDAAALRAVAKGRLLGALMKKHLADGMLPVLIDLKRAIEAGRSPLGADLAATLRALLKDHRRDLVDLLGGDRTLAAEVEWDIKAAEEAEAAAAAKAGAAAEEAGGGGGSGGEAGDGAAPPPPLPATTGEDAPAADPPQPGAAVAAALAASADAVPPAALAAARGSPLVVAAAASPAAAANQQQQQQRPASALAGVDPVASPVAAVVLTAVAAEVAAAAAAVREEEEAAAAARRTPTAPAAGGGGGGGAATAPGSNNPRGRTPSSAGGRAWTPAPPSRLAPAAAAGRPSMDGATPRPARRASAPGVGGWPSGGMPPPRTSTGGGGGGSPALALPRLHPDAAARRPSSGGVGGLLHHHHARRTSSGAGDLAAATLLLAGGDGAGVPPADLRLSFEGGGLGDAADAAAADVLLPSPLAAGAVWNVPPDVAACDGRGTGRRSGSGGAGALLRRSTPGEGGGSAGRAGGGGGSKRKASASPVVRT